MEKFRSEAAQNRRACMDVGKNDANVLTGFHLSEVGFTTVGRRLHLRFIFRIVMEHVWHTPLGKLAKILDIRDRRHIGTSLCHSHRHLIGPHVVGTRHQYLGQVGLHRGVVGIGENVAKLIRIIFQIVHLTSA